MTIISRAMKDMITFYDGSTNDIEHTLKVYAYAQLIGVEEQVDEDTLETIELSAIVHDLACPYCETKYGNSAGYYQQIESEPIIRQFFADYDISSEKLERIVYNVNYHHTYRDVDGIDLQILLEADFLVNASESEKYHRNIQKFYDRIFQTKTGKMLLQEIYQK